MAGKLPADVEKYLDELVKRLLSCLADQILGVYLFGSASNDAYEPGLSDLDVQAVVKSPLSSFAIQTIISNVCQKSLPCPATKLELVIYNQHAVHPSSRHPRFELNFSTGPFQSDHICLDPSKESSHWFLLDIGMGYDLGRCLYGLEIPQTFDVIPREWILEAISDSLQWHLINECNTPNSILNACRSWHFIETGKFVSKQQGAQWAMQQQSCPSIVQLAVTALHSKQNLPTIQVTEFYEIIMKRNQIHLNKK